MRPNVAVVVSLAAVAVALGGCSGEDEHALGDVVEVDFEPSGKGTVAVTDVRDGSTAEIEEAGLALDPDEKAATAYYVDVTFENTGDETATPRSPGGEDPDGSLIHPLTVIDLGGEPFPDCPGVPAEVEPGQEADGCAIILVPEGTEMERVYYHPGGADDFVYWKTD